MRHVGVRAALCGLAVGLPVTTASARFVLLTDMRSTSADTALFEGAKGDSDAGFESATPFQPFTSTSSATTSFGGVQADGVSTQASLVHADVIALSCAAMAELTPPGQMETAGAQGHTTATVRFEVTETSEVYLQLTVFEQGFSHEIFAHAGVQLTRESPCPLPCDTDEDCNFGCVGDPNPGDGIAEGTCAFDGCLLFDALTGPCGIALLLDPGIYRFDVTAIASVSSLEGSNPTGGMAVASVTTVLEHLGPPADPFLVEPLASPATLDVVVPGLPVQSYPLTLTGNVVTTLGGCDAITATMTVLDIQPQEQQIEIDLPEGGSVVVSDLNVHLVGNPPTATWSNGEVTFTNSSLQVTGVVSPTPAGGDGGGEIAAIIVNSCLAQMVGPGRCSKLENLPDKGVVFECLHRYLVDCPEGWSFLAGGTCEEGGAGGAAGAVAGPSATLLFPSFVVSGQADLGLGVLDPTFTVTGDLFAAIQAACPWDCGSPDGVVDTADFLALLGQWGQVGTTCDFGLGAPGVGTEEFLQLLGQWGPCP